MKKDIIIVEDDTILRENLSELLRLDNFNITECSTAKEFFDHIHKNQFKVAVIDIGLPDQSGYELARYLRANTDMGIIILTARTGIENRIEGFSSGADYYFSKPVDSREFIASINNLLCRLSSTVEKKNDSWIFNTKSWRLISPNGSEINLTTKESAFISLLQKNAEKGVEKEFILSELGYLSDEPYGNRALGVMVARLRKKIKGKAGKNSLIKTVHGVGFLLGEKLVRS